MKLSNNAKPLNNLMFLNLKGSKPKLSERFNSEFGEESSGNGFYTRKM